MVNTDTNDSSAAKHSTPLKAIREKCIDCSGGSKHEVKFCQVVSCGLWFWRFGVRPETAQRRYPDLMIPAQAQINGDQQACRESGPSSPFLAQTMAMNPKASF